MSFRLVDRIVERAPGRVVARKALTVGEAYLEDHFPGFPVMPGALMVEAMVQAARWTVWPAAPVRALPLRRLEAVRFTGMVRPGDLLEVEVKAETGDGDDLTWFQGTGRVDGRKVVQARFALGDEAAPASLAEAVAREAAALGIA